MTLESLNPEVKLTNPWRCNIHVSLVDIWGMTPDLWSPDVIKDRNVPFLPGHLAFSLTLFFLNFSLSFHWRLVLDSSKMNGPCPMEHILFHFVQYIMPINQEYICKLPNRCKHSLRYARFGLHLDDKFSFWGPQKYTGVAKLIY